MQVDALDKEGFNLQKVNESSFPGLGKKAEYGSRNWISPFQSQPAFDRDTLLRVHMRECVHLSWRRSLFVPLKCVILLLSSELQLSIASQSCSPFLVVRLREWHFRTVRAAVKSARDCKQRNEWFRLLGGIVGREIHPRESEMPTVNVAL